MRRLPVIILLACFFSPLHAQTFRLLRPVPDTIQTNGSYLYGEPRLSNPSLAHGGIDISIRYDTVRSASDGTVWFVGYDPADSTGGYEPGGCGNYIFVRSVWGTQSLYLLYCHLTRPLVSQGDLIGRGAPLGISGNTGYSTGPHLHFELRMGTPSASGTRTRRNPELWVAITGMGAVYGSIPNAPNSTRVDISPDPKPRPPYTTFSYALTYNFNDPAIGSDEVYRENYAIGDIKPGTYTITALNGAYRRDVTVLPGQVVNADAGVTAAEDLLQRSDRAFLAESYPNPFNSRTTLRVEMPERRHLRVIVFDMLGREVATVADAVFEAGVHHLEFDAGGLSSGLYICRLQATGLTDRSTLFATRRLILQR